MSLQINVQLQHPFSMLVACGRGAGKTNFTKHLLIEGNWLIHPTPQRIIWCYAKHQLNLLKELTEIVQAIEYVQGISSKTDSLFHRNVSSYIILDGLMDQATQDKRISQLFARGRHGNLSVISFTQKHFHKNQREKSTQKLFHKNQREISLNSDYMVIFKSPRDKTQFTNLVKQFMPREYRILLRAFEDATRLPRSYLLLNMRSETDDKFRVRARILNDVYYPQVAYFPTQKKCK